jgi:hypothetical protein
MAQTAVPQAAAIDHAIAVLREAAKQHRAAGDPAHGRACDEAAHLLNITMTPAQVLAAKDYWANIMANVV